MAFVFRCFCSIIVGVALAFILVIAVELVSAVVHPLPPEFTGTKEEMCKHVERYPQWVLALVVPAWTGTTFASTWVATRIGNRGCGAFVGLILLAAVAFNVSMLPYPLWFKIANLISTPVAIYVGLRSSSRREPTPTALVPGRVSMFESWPLLSSQFIRTKKLLALSVALFVISLTQTGYYDNLYPGQSHPDGGTLGLACLLFGWMALSQGILAWLANPLLALSWYFARFCSRSYKALFCSVASVLLALSFLFNRSIDAFQLAFAITSYGIGYWLWIGSIAISLIECIIAIRKQSNIHREPEKIQTPRFDTP